MDKKQELKQRQEEALKLRDKRRGLYYSFSKTDVYKDLLGFMERTMNAYMTSARTGVGMNGKNEVVQLTKDERMSWLDKAAGIAIIEEYIKNNLPK